MDPQILECPACAAQWPSSATAAGCPNFGATGQVVFDLLHQANEPSGQTVFDDDARHAEFLEAFREQMRRQSCPGWGDDFWEF
jgi:hypothetical protein